MLSGQGFRYLGLAVPRHAAEQLDLLAGAGEAGDG